MFDWHIITNLVKLKKQCMESLSTKIKRRLVKNYRPKKLAKSGKRMDLVASQMADVLHLMGEAGKYPLRDKNCLEIGSGWVLSHSLLFWILGAKRVVATDIDPVAKVFVLKSALSNSIDSMIRDTLAPFEDHHIMRERIDRLKKIEKFDF